jgi:HEAT repeat protein
LKDQEENVRMQAAWALGTIRDRRASDPLAAALKDSSPRVRRQAAWALGSLGR